MSHNRTVIKRSAWCIDAVHNMREHHGIRLHPSDIKIVDDFLGQIDTNEWLSSRLDITGIFLMLYQIEKRLVIYKQLLSSDAGRERLAKAILIFPSQDPESAGEIIDPNSVLNICIGSMIVTMKTVNERTIWIKDFSDKNIVTKDKKILKKIEEYHLASLEFRTGFSVDQQVCDDQFAKLTAFINLNHLWQIRDEIEKEKETLLFLEHYKLLKIKFMPPIADELNARFGLDLNNMGLAIERVVEKYLNNYLHAIDVDLNQISQQDLAIHKWNCFLSNREEYQMWLDMKIEERVNAEVRARLFDSGYQEICKRISNIYKEKMTFYEKILDVLDDIIESRISYKAENEEWSFYDEILDVLDETIENMLLDEAVSEKSSSWSASDSQSPVKSLPRLVPKSPSDSESCSASRPGSQSPSDSESCSASRPGSQSPSDSESCSASRPGSQSPSDSESRSVSRSGSESVSKSNKSLSTPKSQSISLFRSVLSYKSDESALTKSESALLHKKKHDKHYPATAPITRKGK